MKEFLRHYFLPHHTNNHRARILHHPYIFFLIVILFFAGTLLPFVENEHGDILGISADIAVTELLVQTNQKRAEQGLPPLTLSPELSDAAAKKAQDMFAKNYWAHNSPDGTTPWVFIKAAGYDYLYAGENLARGFTNSADIINAWMASKGHRENILSSNYQDVGFAVEHGILTGDDTILVVQMFGSKKSSQPQEIATAQLMPEKKEQTAPIPVVTKTPPADLSVASFQTSPMINVLPLAKGTASGIVALFLLAILLDIIIIERKKIVRVVSHNLDVAMFFAVILAVIIMIGRGIIL
jgi:hypothetical protein